MADPEDMRGRVSLLDENAVIPGGATCGLSEWTPIGQFGDAARASTQATAEVVRSVAEGVMPTAEQMEQADAKRAVEKAREEAIGRCIRTVCEDQPNNDGSLLGKTSKGKCISECRANSR